MAKLHVVTGTLKDDQTVTLDEASPLRPGRVLLTVESLLPEPRKRYQDVLAAIRQRQRARGHQPRPLTESVPESSGTDVVTSPESICEPPRSGLPGLDRNSGVQPTSASGGAGRIVNGPFRRRRGPVQRPR